MALRLDIDWYLTEISRASNRFGDKLLLLMKEYNKDCLRNITLDKAKEFYEKFILEMNNNSNMSQSLVQLRVGFLFKKLKEKIK